MTASSVALTPSTTLRIVALVLAGVGACGQLAFYGGFSQQSSVSQHRVQRLLLRRDVGGILDHFEGLAIEIHDRVVGCLNPDLLAALADALILRGLILAAVQRRPELLVLEALPVGLVYKHAVVPSFDLIQRVTQGLQKIVVRGKDRAVHLEFDNRLRFADGCDLAHIVCVLQLLHGHVSRKLDHLEGFSVGIQNRVIGSLNPDLLAAFADALVFGRLVFAAIQRRPELAVFAALLVGRLDKHAVVLALDLLEPVTERLEEVVVGIENCTVHVEGDHRLRFANRGDLPGIVVELFLVHGARLSAMTIPGCGSFKLRTVQYCGAGGRTAAGAISPAET